MKTAGDKAWTPVTDHPNFPKQFHCNDGYLFDKVNAERIANAWNALGGEWIWYAKEFVLLPERARDDSDLQIDLF